MNGREGRAAYLRGPPLPVFHSGGSPGRIYPVRGTRTTHSARNVDAGSTAVVRRAGSQVATSATASSTAPIAA